MVLTSRGGVGCCWVKSLRRLVDYDVSSRVPLRPSRPTEMFSVKLVTGARLTPEPTPCARNITGGQFMSTMKLFYFVGISAPRGALLKIISAAVSLKTWKISLTQDRGLHERDARVRPNRRVFEGQGCRVPPFQSMRPFRCYNL